MRPRLSLVLAVFVSAADAHGQGSPRDERLDRMVGLILPAAREASGKLDSIARTVRRDSGTAIADSTVYRFWRANQYITLRLDRADAIEVEVAIDPGGAAAQYAARRRTGQAPPPIADSLLRVLAAHGIFGRPSEGDMYYYLSAAAVQRRFECCISPGMREYLAIETVAQEHHAAEDGGLMVPLTEIVARVARAEQFLAAYPSSPAVPQVEYDRNRYLAWVLFGIDNTPAFDFRTKALVPEFRRVMETLASQRATEQSGKAAQAMLDVLKRNGYRRTPEVESHIRNGWNELSRQTREIMRPPR